VILRKVLAGIDTKSRIPGTLLIIAYLLLSSGVPLAALDPAQRISQYGHTAWRIQDGNFGGEPVSITQTKDGYLWVGTVGGVFRFDGVQFVSWTSLSQENLPSNHVHYVFGGRDGSLWIGTNSGLLEWANLRSTRFLNGQPIEAIIEDEKGQIWVTHNKPTPPHYPICRIAKAEVRCFSYGTGEDALLSAEIPLAEDASGYLWVGQDTAFVRWRPESLKVYRPAALQSHQETNGVGAFASAADGSVWVGVKVPGHGGGLQHVVNGVSEPFIAPRLNGESIAVGALLLDRQGNLWVGTNDRGIYRIHGTDVDHFGSADGLSGDTVNQFFEDREGDIWVATSKGIDMLRNLPVSTFSRREGVSTDAVQSVLAARDGTIWIGSDHLQTLNPVGVSSELVKSLPGNFVTYLLEDHTGRIWAGIDNTLWTREGEKTDGAFRQLKRKDGSVIGMVVGMAEDSEHNIWVQTRGSPSTLIRIQNLKVQEELPEPPLPLARKLAADPRNGIWLGLVSGDLARFQSGKSGTLIFDNHPASRIQALLAAPDGSILGATEFGVVAWKNGKQQILSGRNGLPCDAVNALNSDNNGDLWIEGARRKTVVCQWQRSSDD
jgi:ligand-binding sensor domain-containing protein